MNNSTEAPISASMKMTYKGVEVIFTKRTQSEKILPYMEDAKKAIDWALTNGYSPLPMKSFGYPKKETEYVEGRVCPLCSNKLVIAKKKDGTEYEKCSTNKYDFATKTTTGCKYVKWPEVKGDVL